jgi:hypothetical protein
MASKQPHDKADSDSWRQMLNRGVGVAKMASRKTVNYDPWR